MEKRSVMCVAIMNVLCMSLIFIIIVPAAYGFFLLYFGFNFDPGSKRFVTPGYSRGTSVAGLAANKLFGKATFRTPKSTIVGGFGTGTRLRVARTRSVARYVGRAVPILGWALLGADAFMFAHCMQKCMKDESC